ncbi:MAG: polysaccharide deacetylase family protein [Erysipelotrichaceae bacterium]|nr:polysaccharide deacetylase family protein [Erysipelotrichaceae bacterium]
MKQKVKIFVIVILSVLALYLIPGLILNQWKTVINIHGDDTVTTEYGLLYNDEGADACEKGTWFPFIHRTVSYKTENNVNTKQLGTYTVTYKSEGTSVTRKVEVKDTHKPVILLKESSLHYTLPGHSYEEEGYSAWDRYDGDLTGQVKSEEKDGTVYYTVTDSHGNKAEAERKIVYDDRIPPVIELDGGSEVAWYIEEGEYKDTYTATDDLDGDITDKVQAEGSVDSTTAGDYTLTYTVTDSYGNTATATRVVHVTDRPINHSGSEDNKTIYLTFDDGPGQYTDQLLGILDKYNVKATFFTTSAFPAYAGELKKEAEAGHTVAVHTYTHNYSRIYASTDAYWADFNTQNEVVHAQTGNYTNMFRFPGGSSNTVSKNYCSGIMHTLASQAEALGYSYYDWNVSSGDAGETTSTDVVYNNVITGISRNSAAGHPSVVLQHDVKSYSVNAVPRIIEWGLKNGYHFEALHDGSYTAHHPIAN